MARRTKRPPTAGANHLEWLRLVEVSGPFLSLPVLKEALPQGLEADDRDVRAELKAAHAEWTEKAYDRAYHTQWIRFVLGRALELGPEVLVDGAGVPANLRVRVAVHHEDLRPDFAVLGFAESGERPTRLVVQAFDAGTDLERPVDGARWKASPVTRMVELLRGVSDGGPTLGLVTNGEQWVLVSAPRKGTTTFVTWHASLWFEEKITLQALRTLLGARRVFGPVDETLERLIERSAEHQHDVTIQLGLQVREAIELLVRRIDELDRGSGRTLLEGVTEKQVYEAAVTVMMRLVFVFYLEEQADLYFPVAKSNFYQRHYALSPLGGSLRAEADRLGPDVLERRTSAWCRLLATFRAIHGGVAHVDMRLPAYGGHLFDPDRFPFLEGRKPGQGWRTNAAAPLAIDDATVLFVLEALQVLRVRDGGANGAETRRLSFRELGVEQIGNVYESLLDHTAKRAADAVVSLKGSKGEEPEIELRELEQCYDPIDTSKLVSFVKERTERPESSIAKDLEYKIEDDAARWLVACGNDSELYDRVKSVAGLVREDRRKQPVVYPKDSIYVTAGADRRSTGTHYTPPSLTEPVVRYALEPLVYVGPAEGNPESEWMLKSAREILALRVCDLACGSGAFLVQACRYLAERLVDAWTALEAANPGKLLITPEGDLSTGTPGERIIPKDDTERQAIARRVVADRCIYGVDINPMAVEMAKLSLWLTTLQREKPFGFLDHALRSGDALLGVRASGQLEHLSLQGPHKQTLISTESTTRALQTARHLRERIAKLTAESIRDVEDKAELLSRADSEVRSLTLIADGLVSAYLDAATVPVPARAQRLNITVRRDLAADALELLAGDSTPEGRQAAELSIQAASRVLAADDFRGDRAGKALHWLLAFPEVFDSDSSLGFDAFVGNPPFLGGRRLAFRLGHKYAQFLRSQLPECLATTDLCVHMLRRAFDLSRRNGCVGLILSDIVAQGDSRESGLKVLQERGVNIYRAIGSCEWPGSAGVRIVHLWMSRRSWDGKRVLDGIEVDSISSFLQSNTGSMEVSDLEDNEGVSFSGHYLMWQGFVLSSEEAARLLASNPSLSDVVLEYIRGDDLNNTPQQRSGLSAVYFGSRSLKECEQQYPEAVDLIRRRRLAESAPAQGNALDGKWWCYASPRPNLAKAIANQAEVLLQPFTSKYINFTRFKSRAVFAHPLVVVVDASYARLCVLQSIVHELWVRQYCSTSLELMRYTASRVFNTFPFPSLASDGLELAGRAFDEMRTSLRRTRDECITDIFNRVHSPSHEEPETVALREIQQRVDIEVIRAYSWGGLEPKYGFREMPWGVRWTVDEHTQAEIMRRLVSENKNRGQ